MAVGGKFGMKGLALVFATLAAAASGATSAAAQNFCVAGLSDGPQGVLLVRNAPSPNASSQFFLVNGDCVEVLGERGDYFAVRFRGLSGWVTRRFVVEKTAAKKDDKPEWVANYGKVRRAETEIAVKVGERVDPNELHKRFPAMSVTISQGEDCEVCGSVRNPDGLAGFEIYWDDRWIVTSLRIYDGGRSGDVTIGRRLVDVVGSSRILECSSGEYQVCRSPFDETVNFIIEGNDCQLITVGSSETDPFKARAPRCMIITGFEVTKP